MAKMIRSAVLAVQAHRARACSQRWMAESGLTALNEPLLKHLGNRVLSGPFSGMLLTPMTTEEHLGPFLLGTYENEIHSVVWSVLNGPKPSVVIDIGAKFGYYAIGLALGFPAVPVHAFDTDWWARRALREMAAANEVTASIQILGEFEHRRFRSLPPRAVIVCDIDGGESRLFKERQTALASATLVIETHDYLVPGTTRGLVERFKGTHQTTRIYSSPVPKEPPVSLAGVFSNPDDASRACSEARPPQSWLYLTPRP